MSHVTSLPRSPEGPDFARSFEATPYRYVHVLGRGGMGTVFEAEHRSLGTRVAVKVLNAELAVRDDLVDRMRLEAQTLARLSHPNVVQVTDLGRTRDGLVYYVMEHLAGRTLRAELDAKGTLGAEESLAIARAVLDALAAAHDMGIVHRDVKPENIFLTDAVRGVRRVKLLDFGIAKVLAESAGAPAALAFTTREDLLLGTPHYLAPEQIAGGPVTPAVDVYAMGLVLYRLFVGRYPFEGRSRDAVLRAHLEEMPERPSKLVPMSGALEQAILRALAKDPQERPHDARALAALLSAEAVGAPVARPAAAIDARTAVTVPLPRAPAPRDENATLPSTKLVAETAEVPAPAPRATRWAVIPLVLLAVGSIVLRVQGIYAVVTMRVDEASLVGAFGSDRDAARQLIDSAFATTCMRHAFLLACSLCLLAVSVWTLASERGARWLRLWSYAAFLIVLVAVALDFAVVTPVQVSLAHLASTGKGMEGLSAGFIEIVSALFALAELASVAYAFVASRGART